MEKRHHVTVARMLYWKDCVVVPPGNEELLTKLLVEFHSSTTAGFLRAYARIATYFYRPRMRRTILEVRPQNDGRYEALNKCLELYLRCFVFDNPRACRGKNPYIHWNDDFEGVRWARPMMFCF
ncbi:hypothetical protein Tco_0397531 [Tanacetum coccineum]